MNTKRSYIEQVRQLLLQDELEKAIRSLFRLLKGSPKLDEALLQSARLQDLKKMIRTGQVDFRDANLTKNQIRAGLLELLTEMESQIEVPEISGEVERFARSKAGKNIVAGDISAGGDVNIQLGDQVLTESKTSRNLRLFLLLFVPLLAIAFAVYYFRYRTAIQPQALTVQLHDPAPNDFLPFDGARLMLQYGVHTDTQLVSNQAVFTGIPGSFRNREVTLRFTASGFENVDTTFRLVGASLQLPIHRDDSFARLQGEVVDESRQPISGAVVSVGDRSGTTDELGRFELYFEPEQQRPEQRLRVSKPGYVPYDRNESVVKGARSRIMLTKVDGI